MYEYIYIYMQHEYRVTIVASPACGPVNVSFTTEQRTNRKKNSNHTQSDTPFEIYDANPYSHFHCISDTLHEQ